MRRSWVSVGTVLLVLAALPANADAQRPGAPSRQPDVSTERRGRRCSQVLPADANRIIDATGQEIFYFRDPVRMVCTGDLVIEADSAVLNRGTGSIQLVGHVVYRDSTRQMTAAWANYLGQTDILFAREDVVLQDLEAGSRVTGDELEFRRETADRPESLMIVRGRRPHAVIPPSARDPEGAPPGPPSEPPSGAPVPIQVWADRLEFEGDTRFRALGNAEIERGDMEGAADTALFDQRSEQMTLLGQGHVENERYRLEGERIVAFLRGDTLREVRAERDTRLISQDLRVRSEQLRIGLDAGQLDRLEAWNPEGLAAFRPPAAPPDTADSTLVPGADTVAPEGRAPAPPAPVASRPSPRPGPGGGGGAAADSLAPVPRAVAVAEGFTLRADSIDARADSGQIREVRAVSRAFGERLVDTLAVELPALVARDWIQGDTITGFFTTAPPAAPGDSAADRMAAVDSVPDDPLAAAAVEIRGADAMVAGGAAVAGDATGGSAADSAEVVLERIVVVGGTGPALSLYRLAPQEAGGEPAINFMRARRITLHLTRGELDRVEADGPIEGIYLDPATARPRTEQRSPVEETGG